MRRGILLQVRLNSQRLPRKALLPLAGSTVVQHVMRALSQVCADVYALLTDAASGPELAPLAQEEGFEVFVGPQRDVLRRYRLAVQHYQLQTIVRACGDEPLVSGKLADEILGIHATRQADLSHFLGIPMGTGVEVIEAAALLRADAQATSSLEREHITTFMYRHPERFTIVEDYHERFSADEARVSLDTPADYELLKHLFGDLYDGDPIEIDEVVAWLKSQMRSA